MSDVMMFDFITNNDVSTHLKYAGIKMIIHYNPGARLFVASMHTQDEFCRKQIKHQTSSHHTSKPILPAMRVSLRSFL